MVKCVMLEDLDYGSWQYRKDDIVDLSEKEAKDCASIGAVKILSEE